MTFSLSEIRRSDHFGLWFVKVDHYRLVWITSDHAGPFWMAANPSESIYDQFGSHWIIANLSASLQSDLFYPLLIEKLTNN